MTPKSDIFKKADALRRKRTAPASGDVEESAPQQKTVARRSVVRRRSGGKPDAPDAAATSAEAQPRTTTRRRSGGRPEVEEAVATAEAIDGEKRPVEEAAPAAVDASDTSEIVEVADPKAKEPETAEGAAGKAVAAGVDQTAEAADQPTEAADETAEAADTSADKPTADGASEEAVASAPSGASLDRLLGEDEDVPRTGRVHKMLSDEEVEADRRRLDGEEIAPSKEVAAEASQEAEETSDGDEDSVAGAEEVEVAKATPAATAAPGDGSGGNQSLEALLKEQGIVQHRPKKGRRIIEDSMSAQTAAAATAPKAEAPQKESRPPRSGVSLFAPTQKRGPVRFINAADLAKDRERGKRSKGRRKAVLNRHDALYGQDRRRGRGRRGAAKAAKGTELTTPAAHKRVVRFHSAITVADLANGLGVKGAEVIRILVGMGQMVTLNELLDFDTAQLVAQEFEYEVEDVSFNEEEILTQGVEAVEEADLEPRAPVVTIMGHVDHGKTTLLDAIRNAKVADGEAGGITQHISAFDVEAAGQRIVFVDTPGHAAFTSMRARGAEVTDIVVLVVAATEGVMPQTAEVIAHAKAADVPIIVAINKMDLPEANPDRSRQQLSEHNLIPESWGGDVQMVEMSAKAGDGLDELLEAIVLQAELLELKADPNRPAQGRVIEAQLEKGRGPVAVALVQQGTLKSGEVVVAGTHFGKVRAIFQSGDAVTKLKEAGPSTPVAILGLSGLPEAGDEFSVVRTEKDAKAVVEHRQDVARTNTAVKRPSVSLDDVFKRLKEGESKELNLIIKADVQGSIEALKKVFDELEVRDTQVNILHTGVGGVTEGDVALASASSAVIVGFGVRPDKKARSLAEEESVDIRTYRVIYEAADEIKQALLGMLEPEFVERVAGHAEVRELYKISRVGTIAGSSVQDGKVARNHQARLLRNSIVIWEGKVRSLRRFKDDVKEVEKGYECGIGLEGYDDLKPGDIIETFFTEEIRPEA